MQHGAAADRLTEFTRLEPEAKQSPGLLARLFRRGNGANDSSSQNKSVNSSKPKDGQGKEQTASSSAPPSTLSSPAHNSSHNTNNGSPYLSVSGGGRGGGGVSVQRSNSSSTVRLTTSGRRGSSSEQEGSEEKELQEEQRRTLSGVLRRLGNILERRGQIPQAYKDSDFKQYWMPDSNCKQCYECGDRFTTFRRRHHCRICGQIFCSRCCNQEVPGRIMGYTGYLRVCTYCCKVVLNFAQNINTSGDVPSDLKENLQETRSKLETLQGSYGSHDQVWVSPTGRRTKVSRVPSFYREDLKTRSSSEVDLAGGRNPFDITPQSEYTNPQTILEERKNLLKDSVQLRELWQLIQDPFNGIELQSHRHRLRTYPNCIIGSELVDWLVTNDKANSRDQAVVIGQALVDAQWVESITSQEQVFCDSYSLYKPGEMAIHDPDPEVTTPLDSSFLEDESEPQWFREITEDGSDEENENSSDLNKIPSTLSPPNVRAKGSPAITEKLPKSQSVFYIDPKSEGAESQPWLGQRSKVRHQSGNTNTSDPGVVREIPLIARVRSGSSVDIEVAQHEEQGFVVIAFRRQDSTSSKIPYQIQRGQSVENEGLVHLDPQLGWQDLENLREENGERLAFQRICKSQWEHLQALTRQLLSKEGLSMKWADVVLRTTKIISKQVRPNVRMNHDDMDIRQYIQIKKIPGSMRTKTEIVPGLVCTKNIQHKKMRHAIQNPRILLLRAPIEYQRVENKFSSLEPQILQEHDYLKNCVARIAALQPDILLVEKTVSRVAQEFILDTGITLVSNVKSSVMERVSRFTQTDIVTSIDGLVSKTTLGVCSAFRVQSYKLPDGRSKTLMFFDGCDPILGCSVTLRGGPTVELKKVKQILLFMIYVTYHLKLELSYLMDSFAMPPPHPDEKNLDLSSSEELSPERETGVRQPITFTLNGEEKLDPNESPATQLLKKDGWIFIPETTIGGGTSGQGKSGELDQSVAESQLSTESCKGVNGAVQHSGLSSPTDLINQAVISVLNESRARLVAESKESVVSKESMEQDGDKQGTSLVVKTGTGGEGLEAEKVETTTTESKVEGKQHSGMVTEQKTTLIIRQSIQQASVTGTSETIVDQNPNKKLSGSQDSLEKTGSKNRTGKTAVIGGEQGKSGLKRLDSDDKSSPLGLPSMSQLDVEQTIMRSRSNSTDARRLADIRRHKRSVSDIALAGNPSMDPAMATANIASTVSSSAAAAISGLPTMTPAATAARGSKEISDFSDPLRDYQRSKDESIFYKDDIKLHADTRLTQNFKKVLGDVLVCASPLQKMETPYLETVQGMECKLRKYFPNSVYWSQHFEAGSDRKSKSVRTSQVEKPEEVSSQNKVNVEMSKKHEFLEMKLTVPIRDRSIQVIMADFRARGGRLIPKHLAPYQNSGGKAEQEKEATSEEYNEELWENHIDCLDPKNHQRIAVLFSSFSYESNCAPYPCVSPWVVTMDFYGRKDITLGAFLERYCFRKNYSCSSESCDTPNIYSTLVVESVFVIVVYWVVTMDFYGHKDITLGAFLERYCFRENYSCSSESCDTPNIYSTLVVESVFVIVVYWVVTMDFYGRKDITLGAFLERYCFRENYSCPSESCDTPNIDHIRRFVHDAGCLTVSLRKLEQPFPVQSTTLMWGVCKKCRQVTPVVPMSLDSWSMSFAKYLELHFHGNQYVRRGCVEQCGHSLHSDHIQCFGFKQTMASFKFSPVTLREVALPSIVVEIALVQLDVKYMQDEAKMLNYKGTIVFSAIVESILKLQHDPQYCNHTDTLEEYERQLQTEQNNYRHKIEALSTMLDDLYREKSTDVQQSLVFVIKDLVLEIKRQIAKAVIIWNDRFQDLDLISKKTKNQSGALRQSKASTVSLDTSESSPVSHSSSGSKATPPQHPKASPSHTDKQPQSDTKSPPSLAPGTTTAEPPVNIVVTKEDGVTMDTATFSVGEEEDDEQEKLTCAKCNRHSNRGVSKIMRLKCGHDICRICFYENDAKCPICRGPTVVRLSPTVKVTLCPVRDRLIDINPAHFASPPKSCQSIPSISVSHTTDHKIVAENAVIKEGHPILEVAVESPEGDKTLLMKSGSQPKVVKTDVPIEQNKINKEPISEKVNGDRPREKTMSGDLIKVNQEKPSEKSGGMKKIISSLLYNSGAVQIQMPFTADEHHLLPPCENIPVIIYDEEPSSIIAYTLSSTDYQYQVDELKDLIASENSGKLGKSATTAQSSADTSQKGSKAGSSVKSKDNGTQTSMRRMSGATVTGSSGLTGSGLGGRIDTGVVKYTPGLDADSVEDPDETDFAIFTHESEKSKSSKQKEPQISYHIELQFSDSNARFYCKVYYADQFRQLRKLIFPEGEDRFIRSLSRCFTWLARGGKSGSAFCKTQDDRFILKQMSRYEVQSFVEFAPHYFQYITLAHREQKPTALAKILGVYRIGFSNSQNNASLRQDVLVMENLFYDRKITQIFDLKGSVRNRLVTTSGKRVEELVLLDENLLKLALDSPLYIRPHSKTVLTMGITNDTQFLSSHLVMDYSLLVGIDENTKELVVGIIDYIRTFTWDKKIEMVVKSTYSHIGGQGKMPTVVSPEVYRSRFLEAMDRYFLHVPDRWTGLGQNVDC